MTQHGFFKPSGVMRFSDISALGADLSITAQFADREIRFLDSIDSARVGSVVFAESKDQAQKIAGLPACVLICTEYLAPFAGHDVAVVAVKRPQQLFAKIGRRLFPQTIHPESFCGEAGISAKAVISPLARLEANVTVEPGAVVGADVEIGSGTVVGPCAVIGAGCKIGRDCVVGPNATVMNGLIGNRVLIHTGARIGQDGFGFVPGERGLEKMPHVGRVIIQDDVEIGANTTIDRGALTDTIVGEGTKIDNLVQIAHNVRIGRNCVITGHCGLSGSVTLGDRVMLGGRVGLADHVSVGDGAQIAAASGVMNDVPAGERWAGLPAQPIKEFFREVAIIRDLVRAKKEKRS
jgi:UDP-3-O-[3-hydroxymyristoyl] glucosamine N-acyltransferase